MAASFPNNAALAALLLVAPLLTLNVASAAELVRPGEAVNYSADVLNSDFRSETLDLQGNVRVTQGANSIEAGAATAKDVRSQNSHWLFQKAVHIVTNEADLQSNSASAAIIGGQLSQARVEGTPAEFAQRGGRSDQQVRGRAGVIEYDFTAGVVKLTDQVWFTNGKDEFRGDVVIYNVREERLQTGGQGRVRGIIRPQGQTGQQKKEPATPESGE